MGFKCRLADRENCLGFGVYLALMGRVDGA